MNAPMPMVTFFKTLNVSRFVRLSRRNGLKFNMLMGYCIGKAASFLYEIPARLEEFPRCYPAISETKI